MARRAYKISRCLCCQHPERARLEAMRAAGVGLDALSAKFEISRDSIYRHWQKHVSEDMKATLLADVPVRELAQRAAQEGVSVLDNFALVRATVMQQLLLAASCNDGHRTAVLAGRATEVLTQIARLTGELQKYERANSITNVTIIGGPEFLALQTMLLTVLRPHPQALAAVLAGLRELEASAVKPAAQKAAPRTIEHQAEAAHASAA